MTVCLYMICVCLARLLALFVSGIAFTALLLAVPVFSFLSVETPLTWADLVTLHSTSGLGNNVVLAGCTATAGCHA